MCITLLILQNLFRVQPWNWLRIEFLAISQQGLNFIKFLSPMIIYYSLHSKVMWCLRRETNAHTFESLRIKFFHCKFQAIAFGLDGCNWLLCFYFAAWFLRFSIKKISGVCLVYIAGFPRFPHFSMNYYFIYIYIYFKISCFYNSIAKN